MTQATMDTPTSVAVMARRIQNQRTMPPWLAQLAA